MMHRTALALVAAGALALAACGSSKSSSSSSTTTSSSSTPGGGLEGSSWNLEKVGPVTAVPGTAASLKFASGGTLSGTTGCNSFNGTYTVDGQTLAIALGPMTQAACTNKLLTAQEKAITTGLPRVTSFNQSGATLELTDAGGTMLLTYGAATSTLQGTAWKVTGVNNGKGAVVGKTETALLTAQFGTDDSFSGFGGCNQLSGPYTASGTDSVKIGPLMSTKKGCTVAALNTIEQEYSAALAAVTTYEISGTTLTLRNSGGATQVTATKATK